MTDAAVRLDKWLWYARFFKSRSLAGKICNAGQVRIGGAPTAKAHYQVRNGDVLTFPQGQHIRVVKVLDLGRRRGPAAEARRLYEDLKPPSAENRLPRGTPQPAQRAPGAGRPTKRERRAVERLKTEL